MLAGEFSKVLVYMAWVEKSLSQEFIGGQVLEFVFCSVLVKQKEVDMSSTDVFRHSI